MIKQTDLVDANETVTIEQRRAFLKLPLAERHSILLKQAEQAADHYTSKESVQERDVWQGGDIVEP